MAGSASRVLVRYGEVDQVTVWQICFGQSRHVVLSSGALGSGVVWQVRWVGLILVSVRFFRFRSGRYVWVCLVTLS